MDHTLVQQKCPLVLIFQTKKDMSRYINVGENIGESSDEGVNEDENDADKNLHQKLKNEIEETSSPDSENNANFLNAANTGKTLNGTVDVPRGPSARLKAQATLQVQVWL